MKKIKILSALILIVIVITSCAKPVVNNCTLTKVSQNDNLFMQYFYLNNQLERVEKYSIANGVLIQSYNITRDVLNRIDYIDVVNPDGSLFYRRKVTYNVDGNIGQNYYLTDLNNDLYPETMGGYIQYVYNTDHEIVEARTYNSSSVYQYSSYFTWMNGNLTRIDTGPGTAYDLYTYDDKRSAYQNIQKDQFYMMLNPSILSANNLVVIHSYDALGNLTFTGTTNSYTYNEDQYPVTASTNNTGYDYNCVPE
jgi:hypothetical protein